MDKIKNYLPITILVVFILLAFAFAFWGVYSLLNNSNNTTSPVVQGNNPYPISDFNNNQDNDQISKQPDIKENNLKNNDSIDLPDNSSIKQPSGCTAQSFVSAYYRQVSFKYDNCKFIVYEMTTNTSSEFPQSTIYVQDASNNKEVARLEISKAQMGYGPSSFSNGTAKRVSNLFVPKAGKVLSDNGSLYQYFIDVEFPGDPNFENFKNVPDLNPFGSAAKFMTSRTPIVFNSDKQSSQYTSGFVPVAINMYHGVNVSVDLEKDLDVIFVQLLQIKP